MFTRRVKMALTALRLKGTRPDEVDLNVLVRLGYANDHGHITDTGRRRAEGLLAEIRTGPAPTPNFRA